MNCRWRAEFGITPTLFKSEVLPPYEFIVAGNSTTVLVEYETDAFDSVLAGAPKNEYADGTLARRHAEDIRNLLLDRMVYCGIVEPLSVKVRQISLMNKEDLKEAGATLSRRVEALFDTRSVIYDGDYSLTDTVAFMKRSFSGKSAPYRRDVRQAAEWLSKSVDHISWVDSFLSGWIAFNSLLCAFTEASGTKKGSEADHIKEMIDTLGPGVAAAALQDTGDEMAALATYGSKSRSNEEYSATLSQLLTQGGAPIEVLKFAALSVYGIRNILVHESPSPVDESITEKSHVCSEWIQAVTPLLLQAFAAY